MRRLDINDINTRIKEYSDNEYSLIDGQEYTTVHAKLNILHTKCNNIFQMSMANLLSNKTKGIKTGCTHCRYINSANTQRYTHEDFIKSLDREDIEEYTFLDEYVDTNTKITVKHKCGNTYDVRPRELKQGNSCPKCQRQRSKGEKELFNYIESILPEGTIIESNKRSILKDGRRELDIFLPDHNIAFEYNGTWWHREEVNKDSSHKKVRECAEVDIRLITVFEHEWKFKQDIVKSKIAHILGVANSRKVYARKTVVKEVSARDKSQFLDVNHIQGKDKSFLNLGLYLEEELVALMTISKPRKALNSSTMELSRFATKMGISVVGGFSKLLSKLNSYLPVGTVISTYASLAYSVGDLYDNNGFELKPANDGIIKPSYWYMKMSSTTTPLHRFNFNKKEIARLHSEGKLPFFDETLTEKQNMLKNGYYTFLDCGNLAYTYTIK